MSGRAEAVGDSFVDKLFGGKYAGRVERHLGPTEIRAFIIAAYDIGYRDGRQVKPEKCESCGAVSNDLKLYQFIPGVITPPGAKPKARKLTWKCPACAALVDKDD